MRRDELIEKLKSNADVIRSFGVENLYLFGSHARDDATPMSDVDLFFDRDPGKFMGFRELLDLNEFLEKELAVKVDLITRTSLHPVLRPEIEATAVKVL
jgi:predicted nucleotidyltransferase